MMHNLIVQCPRDIRPKKRVMAIILSRDNLMSGKIMGKRAILCRVELNVWSECVRVREYSRLGES